MSDFKFREVFNEKVVEYISNQIKKNYKEFDLVSFQQDILNDLDKFSYGDRSKLIRRNLEKYLPKNPQVSIPILVDSLGPERDRQTISGYEGFYVQPLGEYVSKNGIEHFDLSMNALFEMTKRFTSEGPIRTFIRQDWKKVQFYLNKWVKDENPHVRRLVSEGTRPRLPLSSPIDLFIDDPAQIVPYLLELKSDPVLFVRRSVANNINDISKDNPKKVIELLKEFDTNDQYESWIIKHSLRTLLKKTYSPALQLIGYRIPPIISDIKLKIISEDISISKEEKLKFSLSIDLPVPQKLLIHYKIHYMKASGKLKPKAFILRDRDFKRGFYTFQTTQSFRQMSTRKHYKGNHKLEIIINGVSLETLNFNVVNN